MPRESLGTAAGAARRSTELDVFDVLLISASDTRADRCVSVRALTVLAVCHAGSCMRTQHYKASYASERLRRAEHGHPSGEGPLLYTRTCVMQRGYYGAALYRMLERVPATEAVQLVKEPVTKNAVTPSNPRTMPPFCSPALRGPRLNAAAFAQTTSPLFMGTAARLRTGNPGRLQAAWDRYVVGSKVRQHLKGVASADSRVLVRELHRRGPGASDRFMRTQRWGRLQMPTWLERCDARPSACSPGDSATSSRLYDAIASLCVPIVIIGERLWVPTSPF